MMKTIVISGASSGVGKTTLANALVELLAGSIAVKIGHHKAHAQAGRGPRLYPMGTPLSALARDHRDKRVIIIESNSILQDASAAPDLCIYLDGKEPKPSAAYARQCADMRRGEPCPPETIKKIAGRLGLTESMVGRIAWLSGARPELFTIGILAGGESRRMGRDKAFLEMEGRPAVLRLYEILKGQCDRVIVSVHGAAKAFYPGLETVSDREPARKGPLMGIASVLAASSTDLTGIVACDIPHIDPNLFPLLCSKIGDGEVAVPAFDGSRPEPLLAVYRKSVLPHAERSLARGDYRVADLFKKCRTVVVAIPHAGWYSNINTPLEYERFCTMSGGSGEIKWQA